MSTSTSRAPARTEPINIAELLTFPSKSNGLSEFKPKLNIVSTRVSGSPRFDVATSSTTSGLPHRKAARLEGDSDHSTSSQRQIERVQARDKGKGRAIDDRNTNVGSDGVRTYTLVHQPDEKNIEDELKTLPRKIVEAIHQVLSNPPFTKVDYDTAIRNPRYKFVHEEVYSFTRSVVLIANDGKFLYDKLKYELRDVCLKIRDSLIEDGAASMAWLERLSIATKWFGNRVTLVEQLLTYLDRVFVKQNKDMLHIRQLARQTYKETTLENVLVLKRIQQGLEEWIRQERKERAVHPERHIIITLVKQFEEYSKYNEAFFQTYLAETIRFYEEESERQAIQFKDEAGFFVSEVDKRLKEENARSAEVIPQYAFDHLQIEKAAHVAFMQKRLPWLGSGVERSVDSRQIDKLEVMYNRFEGVGGLGILCEKFKAHVQKTVAGIINDTGKEDEMVDRLLDLKAFLDEAVLGGFHSNKTFGNAVSDAFLKAFKVRKIKPAEMIAKYLDREMRRGQKGASDEEFGNKLDAVLGLYRFTEDKDVFRTFYHRALAKRLLLNRSASDDFEKSVLKTLKTKFDPEFDMGENMFRDLVVSNDLNSELAEKAALSRPDNEKPKLHAAVLEAAYWPFSSNRKETVLLPAEMSKELERFRSFYSDKYKNRVLNFDHSLGTAQLRAKFNAGQKELHVTLYQSIVLLLFNDRTEIPFPEIKEQTKMDDAELRRTLQSLACGKKKVLKKRPTGRDVDDNDSFVFNSDFTDERARVYINQIQVKETPEESKKAQVGIELERKSLLDAAIVRIMKAKKKLAHQALIQMVVDVMKKHFAPDVSMIKSRFEQLIEQEYMRRDDDERNVYVYVA